ncbi:hypothetical protein Unana1_06212 [Umbelopsis nana]
MDTAVSIYEQHILPLLSRLLVSRRNKVITTSAAVLLVVLYNAYQKLTRPPKQLRHLPTVNSFLTLKALVQKWPMNDVATKITIPVSLSTEHGLYTRLDPNGWTVHVQNPAAAKKLLLKLDVFPKIKSTDNRLKGTLVNKYFGGPNIVVLNGDQWKAHRMVVNPAFHRSMPLELFGELTNALFRVMDTMDATVDFLELMTRFTLDAIGRAGFDFNFNAIENPKSEWVVKYHNFNSIMFDPLYMLFPVFDRKFLWALPKRREAHRNLDDFLEMLKQLIVQKRNKLKHAGERNKKDSEKDLLTLMIESEFNGEGALTDEEFAHAGADSAAFEKDIQEKARQEAIAIFGDEPHDVIPTLEQTKQLTYINCIIKENMRKDNSASGAIPRIATEDTDLAGVFIPKGTQLALDIHDMHHNPRNWKNPEEFHPERFLPGGEGTQGGLSWIPFSSGGRQCIGMNFSLAEQRVFLPLLLRKYEWNLPEDSIHKDGMKTANFGTVTCGNLGITFKRRY